MVYSWLSFILFTIAISCLIFHIRFPAVVLESPFLSVYFCSIISIVLGFFGKRNKVQNKVCIILGRMGFYGSIAIIVYYAAPFYLVIKSTLTS